MTIQFNAGGRITGLSTDTKPTLLPDHYIFHETDTGDDYTLLSGVWTLKHTTLDDSIGDAEIQTHTSTKISITNKAQLNSQIAYQDGVNGFTIAAQNFGNGVLGIFNPAASSKYTILSTAIAANRNITLPLLTGNDVFVFQSHPQILSGKTIISDATNPATAGILRMGNAELISWRNVANDGNLDLTVTSSNLLEFNGSLVTPLDISCKATKSAGQSLTDNTFTIITWNTEDYDTDTMHDLVTNNSRITIKTAGKYMISCQANWASNGTGNRIVQFKLNGTTNIGKSRKIADSASEDTLTYTGDFALNDYIEVEARQTSGGSLNFAGQTIPSYFEAHKIN